MQADRAEPAATPVAGQWEPSGAGRPKGVGDNVAIGPWIEAALPVQQGSRLLPRVRALF